MKYVCNSNLDVYDVYKILAVEERDERTMQLAIDRPWTDNKQVITREAFSYYSPVEKDYLVVNPVGGAMVIIKRDNLSAWGEPRVDVAPPIAPPVAPDASSAMVAPDAASVATNAPNVTSGVSSTNGSPTSSVV